MARTMKTQPLSIDPTTLEGSKRAAEAAGMSWSAYAARAIKRQVMEDNMRAAAELDRNLDPEQTAARHAWHTAHLQATAERAGRTTR